MTKAVGFYGRWCRLIGLGVLVISAGCRDDGPTAGGGGASEVVAATFEVSNGERFAVELTTPELVDHAQRLLAGDDISAIPNGIVVRDDASVNAPWSWHIDPESFEFAFATIEVCDGLPSDVERGVITSDAYCPWSATVIDVGPARDDDAPR